MKLLSFAVPCYNSAGYMEKCIDSLLVGGDEVEIIIVDDGSTDETPAIADRLSELHPSIIRVIHQENGGHGEAVNSGIREAKGLFFKVIDSDDWVKKEAYLQILDKLKELAEGEKRLDMLISNFVYEKTGENHKRVMQYRRALPVDRVFSWSDVGHFKKGQYILMHSVIFRTKLLRECGLVLPGHTFYVDNIYVFEPLVNVKNMYYMDVNFYRYFIGRDDQSVNESVMIKRVDQQINVNKRMYEFYSKRRLSLLSNRKLRHYMYNYLEIITTVSSILLILEGTGESMNKKNELWKWMAKTDLNLERRLRGGFLGQGMNLPGRIGRKISLDGYHVAQKIFHFN